MRIAFYAPLKPVDHPHPSGDLVIGRGLYHFLQGRGHRLGKISRLRVRWIYWKPWLWPRVVRHRNRSLKHCREMAADLWLTYHSYYKAPDLLGSYCCRHLGLPYAIFQGIYSTKRRKRWTTWAGFVLNRQALLAAHHVFTNRKEDLVNLARIVPEVRLTYVVPGIFPQRFSFDPLSREQLRREMEISDGIVVVTAAMFRPGVKTEGLSRVIRSCGELSRTHVPLYLIIAGDGKEGPRLRRMADHWLPGRVRFLGKVAREEMFRFYSAGDLFVFPGIRESLGMVYLEAQSCGLPVVAFADGGVPEVVADEVSGYLVRPFDVKGFNQAIAQLMDDPGTRRQMGKAASNYVRERHDLNKNYRIVEDILLRLAREQRSNMGGRRLEVRDQKSVGRVKADL